MLETTGFSLTEKKPAKTLPRLGVQLSAESLLGRRKILRSIPSIGGKIPSALEDSPFP